MSKIALSGDASGTGTFTIASPNSNSNYTLTLPTSTGTMALLQTPSFATTIGVGGATPATTGAGITFPATQSASSNANTLDDYEEGTWTPTLSFSSGSVTYTTRLGSYVKVGRVVTLNFWIYGASVSSPSGDTKITNLPFATSSTAYRPSTALRVNQLSITGQIMAWAEVNVTNLEVITINNGTPASLNANLITGGNFEFGGMISYIVDN